MHSTIIYSVLSLLTICHLSLSAPVSVADSKKLHSRVNLVRNPSYAEHGPSEYLHAAIKYNIKPTHPEALHYSEIVDEDRRLLRRDVTLGLEPLSLVKSGSGYISPVTVGAGANAQAFNVILDSGSADFWVFSDLMRQNLVGPHNIYHPKNSSSAVPTGQQWRIRYGDNSTATGVVYNDTLGIAGIMVPNQAVEAAVQVDQGSLNMEADGLLGLSLGSNTIGTGTTPTTLYNLFFGKNTSPQLTTSRVFTCALTRPNETGGFYTFGYIDQQLVNNQSIQYTPIVTAGNPNGYWTFQSDYFVINGQQVPRPGNMAFADTGTTLILVADDILPLIYAPLGGRYDPNVQGWVFPSTVTDAQVPTLGFPAGNNIVTLALTDIARGLVDENWIFGAIQSRGDFNFDIFGDVWLRNIYAIFDVMDGNDAQFGLVPRAPTAA
jgi:hypothetical protein